MLDGERDIDVRVFHDHDLRVDVHLELAAYVPRNGYISREANDHEIDPFAEPREREVEPALELGSFDLGRPTA